MKNTAKNENAVKYFVVALFVYGLLASIVVMYVLGHWIIATILLALFLAMDHAGNKLAADQKK